MTCWNLGLKHVHAMAESVSASEQPEYAEALFRHETCDPSVIDEWSCIKCVDNRVETHRTRG